MGYFVTEMIAELPADCATAASPRLGAKKELGAPFLNPILSSKYWDAETKTLAYQLRDYGPGMGQGLRRQNGLMFDGSESAAEILMIYADDAAMNGLVAIRAVAGTWKCFEDDGEPTRDNGKPLSKDSRITIYPTECPGIDECSKKHEEDHERYLGPCCEKAQEAWRKKQNLYDKRKVKMQWRAWYIRHSLQTECEAYKVNAKCNGDYYYKYGCCKDYVENSDPKGKEHWRSCCDKSVAENTFDEDQATKYCKEAKLADIRFGKAPQCPSF